MLEKDVIVTTKYGAMPSFAVCPEAPGQYPGIIFYMDAPGIREELRNMARRIARHGYFCLLPDMYYRLGTLRFDVARRDDAQAQVFLAAMRSLTNKTVMDDTGGMLAWLDAQDQCKPGPVGCLGYCMSGQYITSAAAFYPHRIAAAASLYGVGIITDKEDSPHLHLDKIKGELYYAFAETDRSVPAHIPDDLEKMLSKTKIKYKVKTFPGTEHGFAFPERAIYDTLAAEETWDKMFAMFDRTLK
ncbi:MAG TPA: dienelactone hydrolase family protein [Stellaceae bacterium]|jgi:carboxymethylenebutenolidase|nr:dienelactone hydrolase family protein [Stellaceae bacterium]